MDAKLDDNVEEQFYSTQRTSNTTYRRKAAPVKIEAESSIFDLCLGSKEVREKAQKQFKEQRTEAISNIKRVTPGFFTPYTNKTEFGIFAAAPLPSPVILSLVSAATAITAVGAALTALGSLVFAAGSGLHGLRKPEAKETAHEALLVAAKAGIVAAICTAISIAAAVAAVLIAPVALAYFVTRSGATIIDAMSRCLPCCSSEENERSYTISMSN
ncbi:hypothetical protein [Legionella sp. PC997]|uniref:hypothetical protein n=1 Tax=Legionella sp. PC997 TaxID=2755562 RepID=UPI0015F967B8|nr:hypothetical protein [Legionella sp. PC997]QMT61857.1 hypothetical protein HBNCFIEN_03264 [Legionella sp. PC997]